MSDFSIAFEQHLGSLSHCNKARKRIKDVQCGNEEIQVVWGRKEDYKVEMKTNLKIFTDIWFPT